ncbi:MAG: SAM-dependent methyltransferase [Gammaproteobacteria bacterium]|nr:MAG: SAM-dependent methyltransferase [Gammaproteobacteria bacterium]RLA14812.1 MAG: SAM-dependent methyltransferase [Gammaproteobacteria bacterium]
MRVFSDKKIIDSWRKNAAPWIVAIQENQIESRRLITDQAIIDRVMSLPAKNVLDIGCGEGWLARKLTPSGLSVTGLDVVPELVQEAKKSATGKFHVMAYEELSVSKVSEKFDVAICNFSLLGKESVEHLFKVVRGMLNKDGYFIVQTLHPSFSDEHYAYEDGWREGSWTGFRSEFSDPAPWYFRTIESWLRLFREHGYGLVHLKEPISPATGNVASLIMVGRVSR